jgi:molybdopterin-dependent oxidoreductase alpha subunit
MDRKGRPGGGWPAIAYTVEKALEVGPWKLWSRMRSRNACKTCAVGMGGMKGGMVNEVGHFPEVCKKSLQAQVADMKGAIPADFFDKNSLSDLLKLTPKQAEDAGRLCYPVALDPGATHFQPITWEDAMSTASLVLRSSEPEQVSFYSSGRSSNEAAFLLQSFARVYGTNNVNNCSFYCHQASGVALKMVFGTGTSTVDFEDLAKADLVFLIGANPASNHPRLMTQLANLRQRGGQVIVVNPLRESGLESFHVPSQIKSLFFGTKIASLYVQPYAGGDVAFLVGILKALVESGKINDQFLASHTQGAEAALDYAKTVAWVDLIRESGVEQCTIEKAAQLLATAKQAIFAWAMGLTHHESGVDNILALCNVALATGHVGRPGAGMMPIRGHSNVQGVGSIGFHPQLQTAVKEALEVAYKTSFPTAAGYDTFATMEAAEAGKIKALIALGGNLWGSNPDSAWASRCMQKIKAVVYLSTKLNPGHFHGRGERTLILPVLARDEESQPTSQESMFNYVRLSAGGTANVPGSMRAESEVICDLANRVLGDEPVDWSRLKDHKEVRRLIAEVIPGWQEIATIDDTKREFTIGGRIFHTPVFKTESGRAIMHQTPLPKTSLQPGSLRLVTLRSEGQFNTVVYEEADIYRGMPHRNCILVSDDDAKILNLKDGQRVTVRGEAGSLKAIEIVVGRIRQGVAAMFYPEANVLIKGVIDKRSKTPAFKGAPVWIEPN